MMHINIPPERSGLVPPRVLPVFVACGRTREEIGAGQVCRMLDEHDDGPIAFILREGESWWRPGEDRREFSFAFVTVIYTRRRHIVSVDVYELGDVLPWVEVSR